MEKKLFYLLVVILMFFYCCKSKEDQEKELIISKIEQKLELNSNVSGFDQRSLTLEDRLFEISKFVESEYNGKFKIRPRIGNSSNQILINNNDYFLQIVMDYFPIKQNLNMDFVYKKNNELMVEQYEYTDNDFEINHMPNKLTDDTLDFNILYLNKSYGVAFINYPNIDK